jgi:hypothetical protein
LDSSGNPVKRSHKKGASAAAAAAAAAKAAQHAAAVAGAGEEGAVVEDDDDDEAEIDGDEPRYCYCNNVSYGSMVACDAEGCKREWFHLACVGLKVPPKENGKCATRIGYTALTNIARHYSKVVLRRLQEAATNRREDVQRQVKSIIMFIVMASQY